MKTAIALLLMLLGACTQPQFVVTSKTSADTNGNCVVSLAPINRKAITKYSHVTTALVDYWDYNINDTLTLNPREFTNYKKQQNY